MRLYFTDMAVINKLADNSLSTYFILQPYLTNQEIITKIYSADGIFYVMNNVMNRLNIKDISIEHTTISNINFIVDKSTVEYETDWSQLNPKHMVETVYVYTYILQDSVDAMAMEAKAEAIGPGRTIQLTIEKTQNIISEVYFTIKDTIHDDYENIIVTFLSQLNLC
jgi:hypothetical protein